MENQIIDVMRQTLQLDAIACYVPVPMSEVDFDTLVNSLTAMKPKLVTPKAPQARDDGYVDAKEMVKTQRAIDDEESD